MKRPREEGSKVTVIVKDGLRIVEPYQFEFSCHAKARWLGRDVLEVCAKEFIAYPPEHYVDAAETGELRVVSRAGGSDYAGGGRILQSNDLVVHCAQVKENPVPAIPLHIVFENDQLVAINKPNGWPAHPCGNYRHNSVTEAMKIERKDLSLAPLHRIDRLTSGILLLAKTAAAARAGQALAGDGTAEKLYVARVSGKLEAGFRVEEPIACIDAKLGKYAVRSDGKWSVTEFEVLETGEFESLLLCKPLTGRTHQIRVHLQHVGHPIVNDECYGGFYDAKHPHAFPRIKGSTVDHCTGIFLHAWKYKIPGLVEVETTLPDWANKKVSD